MSIPFPMALDKVTAFFRTWKVQLIFIASLILIHLSANTIHKLSENEEAHHKSRRQIGCFDKGIGTALCATEVVTKLVFLSEFDLRNLRRPPPVWGTTPDVPIATMYHMAPLVTAAFKLIESLFLDRPGLETMSRATMAFIGDSVLAGAGEKLAAQWSSRLGFIMGSLVGGYLGGELGVLAYDVHRGYKKLVCLLCN